MKFFIKFMFQVRSQILHTAPSKFRVQLSPSVACDVTKGGGVRGGLWGEGRIKKMLRWVEMELHLHDKGRLCKAHYAYKKGGENAWTTKSRLGGGGEEG